MSGELLTDRESVFFLTRKPACINDELFAEFRKKYDKIKT
jgi:hypothetical protein